MKLIKRFLRDIQEYLERRFVGGAFQKMIWRYRHLYKWGWAEGYLTTVNHSHRKQIVEAAEQFEPIKNILEVGCASGANLIRLRERFPDAELIGIDINSKAINVGKEYFANCGDSRVNLIALQLDQLKIFEDNSVDIVISDAVMMCITPDRIKGIIAEMIRVARKGIIFNEYHGTGLKNGNCHGGRWIYDFRDLITQELPQVKKIEFDNSMFTGGIWDDYGKLIKVYF